MKYKCFIFTSNNQNKLTNLETELNFLLRNVNTYGDLSSVYKENEDYKVLGSTLINLKYPLIKETKNTIIKGNKVVEI